MKNLLVIFLTITVILVLLYFICHYNIIKKKQKVINLIYLSTILWIFIGSILINILTNLPIGSVLCAFLGASISAGILKDIIERIFL